MRKLLMVLGLVLACQMSVYADPEMPVGNDPVGFYDKVYALVEKSDPRAGVFFNAEAGEFSACTEAKLFTKEVKGYDLDLVAGYGHNKLIYGALTTDVLAAFSKLTGANLSIPWIELNCGPGVGYTFDAQSDGNPPQEGSNFAYGFTFNASKKW